MCRKEGGEGEGEEKEEVGKKKRKTKEGEGEELTHHLLSQAEEKPSKIES